MGEELSTTQEKLQVMSALLTAGPHTWVGTVTGDIAGVLAKIVSHPFMPTLVISFCFPDMQKSLS